MKTCVIVGGGPTRKLVPWDDPHVEIWQMNEAASLTGKRADAVFQMHDPGIYKSPDNRVDRNHWEWLKQYHNIPIYMKEVDPEVPDSIEYPLKEVKGLISNISQMGMRDKAFKQVELITFTGTFMVALAILKRFSRIKCYGIELINTEEYRYQREAFLFWIGVATGRGIDVEIYGGESLFQRPLYGYETFKEFRDVEFTVDERIMLHDMVLPQQADMISMRIIRDFKRQLEFSEQEVQDYQVRAIAPGAVDPFDENFVNESTMLQYRWGPEAVGYTKQIEVGEVTRKVVQESFKKFDKEGKFTEALLALYEKFSYE